MKTKPCKSLRNKPCDKTSPPSRQSPPPAPPPPNYKRMAIFLEILIVSRRNIFQNFLGRGGINFWGMEVIKETILIPTFAGVVSLPLPKLTKERPFVLYI